MLGKRLINTGGVSCTTDTVQILDPGSTQSAALYRFEDNAYDTAYASSQTIVSSNKVIDLNVNGYSSGTTITDSTSNSNNATIVGNVTYSNPSGSNGRFNLDGASDYLRIGASATFNSPANFTVEGWFKPDNITDLDHFFTIWDGGSNSKLYLRFTGTSGALDGYTYTSAGGTSANVITSNAVASVQVNKFNHIVMTYIDGGSGSIAIYINGVLAGSATPGAAVNVTGTEDLYVGSLKNHAGSYDFDGEVGQVRFYSSALTASEVLQNFNATRALYAAYDGTASGATYVTGKFGKAASFDGTNDYISADNPNASGGARSFSAWIKTTSTAFQTIIGNGGASHARGLNMFVYNNKLYSTSGNGSGENYGPTSSANVNTGEWVHCALTMSGTASGSILKTYVNGTLDGTHTTTVAITDTSDAFRIGGRYINGSYASAWFNGQIDQVRIFSTELSPGEVNSLYNETTTTAALGTITNPSTVAYYKMADAIDETGSYDGTATDIDFNVEGKYGFAGKFNGSSSRINTGLIWPGGTQISWSFWVNTAGGVNQYFFGDFNSTGTTLQGRFAAQFHNSNVLYILTTNGSTSTTTNAGSITSYLNKWTHVVITANGTTVKAYLDGALFNTSTGTAITAGAHPFVIGAYTDGSSKQNVNGKIDQVRIFNKEISADEVTKLYNEIQCADTITTPESYFNSVLYTGNGSTTQTITGVGFEAGFTWIKDRSVAESHALFDSVRGANQWLHSNTAAAQTTYSGNYGLLSWNSNGFQVGNGTAVNDSSENYVAWNWKAAASNTTNNDGTIASTVSASPKSGFSVVKFTAPSSEQNFTIGHGLTTKPGMVILKSISTSGSNWFTWHKDLSAEQNYLYLNGTAGEGGLTQDSRIWGQQAFTSSVISTRSNYTVSNSDNVICYCFANVDGYQRIGSYVGNGSANGPFVYTGFEPAWLLVKETSTNGGYWIIVDNKRNTSNPRKKNLFPNATDADTDYGEFDFFSNGFQPSNNNSDTNNSGDTYLFMAIAANPDTTAPTKANSFKTKIYTGNGGTQSITGLGFKPDLTWIKSRDTADNNNLGDSVRGVQKFLYSNLTSQELTSANYLTSFDADGFSIGSDNSINKSSDSIVSWNWKALDHDRNLATMNTDGTIPSSVSVNDEAGFSIIKWVSDGGSTATTKGHGMSAAVDFAIVKSMNSSSIWMIFHKDLPQNKYIQFSADALSADGGTTYFTTSTTTLGFRDGSNSSSGDKMIAYAWREISGYSSIGTYTGNGSATGPTVTTGFEPSWVILKCTSSGGTNWRIIDSTRDTTNPRAAYLNADTNSVEETSYDQVNFLSNGFQLATTDTSINGNGNSHIYMAFK